MDSRCVPARLPDNAKAPSIVAAGTTALSGSQHSDRLQRSPICEKPSNHYANAIGDYYGRVKRNNIYLIMKILIIDDVFICLYFMGA